MPYITTCFYCQKSLQLRESILVKASLSREILARMHPVCWGKLIASAEVTNNEYRATVESMQVGRYAKVQARSPG